LLALLILTLIAAAPARAAMKALILGDSVTPGSATDGSGESLEQQQAELDGFVVDVVTGVQWDAMTATDFAQYQVLIVGDPTCVYHAYGAAESNVGVWGPVVMGSGGNRVAIGTDPVFHHYSHPGGTTLVKNGIAFAGAISGATGAYIDLSCTEGAPMPVPILDALTIHGPGSWESVEAPCAGDISIVAQSGPTSGLHDTDLSGWSCSVHEFFDKFPSDWTPLAIATDPTVTVTYAATDVDTGLPVSGSPYIMVSGTGVVIHSNISLSPATATNPAGTSHTVTATVLHDCLPDGTGCVPEAGVTVTFTVDSGPNAGATGTGVTDANGQATFTWTDAGGPGMDTVSATFFDDVGAIEKATATKTWVARGCTPANCDDGNPCTDDHCDSSTGAFVCVHDPNTAPCDDGDLCTTGDHCDSGVCSGLPVVCNTPSDCHGTPGTCDPTTGACQYPNAPDGTLCSDGDPCTVDDACVSGTCTGSPRNCDDDNPCTIDSCSNDLGAFKCNHVNCDTLPGTACPPGFPQCVPVGCGNGRIDPGETCDPPDATPIPGVVPPQPKCRTDCTFCGDGKVDTTDGETCDDGNTVSGCIPHSKKALDGCLNSCTVPICDDPSQIRYGSPLDRYDAHGMLTTPPVAVNPAASDFVLELTTAFNDIVYRGSLNAGTLVGNATGRVFKYANPAASKTGGFFKLKLQKMSDGSYRATARAYGQVAPGNQNMVTHVFIGTYEWNVPGVWTKTNSGWSFKN
jgi:hypothetical protein